MAYPRKRDFQWPLTGADRLTCIANALHDPDLSRWVLDAMGACQGGIRRMVFHAQPKVAGPRRSIRALKRTAQGTIATYWASDTITYEDRCWWINHLANATGLTAKVGISPEEEQAIAEVLWVAFPSQHYRDVDKRNRLAAQAKSALLRKKITVLGRVR